MTDTQLTSLPLPSADMELYNSIMEMGFQRYPERLKNYQRFKQTVRSETIDHLPIKLDIENVSRCNFRCTMCQVSEWPKGQRADDMQFDDFKNLLDEQYGLVEIKLQGMGEPLMNAEPYFEMIKYARSRNLWVRSTNNGSLLHLKDNYKKLIDSDICEIQISVDGATKDSFEIIRRGSKFERVVENCKLLNAYAKEVGKHRTRMWTVVQNDNFNDLEQFPILAGELGFARLTLSLDLVDWGQERWRDHNKQVDRHDDFSLELAQKLITLGNSVGVEVTFWHVDEKYNTSAPEKLCPWPFERAFISSDMRVVPCCMIGDPDVLELGDGRSLNTVWNDKKMRGFRTLHLKGQIPNVCKSCYG